MKNECAVIRDLLPLYAEKLISPDTAEFVQTHLKSCAACRREYEQTRETEVIPTQTDTASLAKLRRKMRNKKIQTVALTAVIVVAVLVSAFAWMNAPEFFPYSEDLMTITENADKSITVTFNERITGYSCQPCLVTDTQTDLAQGDRYCYDITASVSLWDRLFSDGGIRSAVIEPKQGLPFTVYYCSNNGEEDICVYGQPLTNGGRITLPRSAPGYYLMIAFACFICLLILRLLLRRKAGGRVLTECGMMYPASYVAAHLLVMGFRVTTYTMQRDLTLILFLSVLLWCGLLLAHAIYRLCRERRDGRKAETASKRKV